MLAPQDRNPVVLHVDLDAFFASVEQRDDPGLVGQPVLVGGSAARGVVAAASYEARRFGCHSAMPMAQALRLCPRAVVISPRHDRYGAVSRQFFALLEEFSPLVESISVDEAFVDGTGSERLFGGGAAMARAIKDRVLGELDLVASVGVAPTKFAAKIASDLDKPDGLVVVEPDDLLAFLHPLPVERLWGAGRVTTRILRELGLSTIGDVARYPEAVLARRLGPALGGHLAALCRGEDPRAVSPHGEPVSVGHEETFDRDIGSRDEVERALYRHADRVAARLRRAGLRARTIVLKLKYGDFRLHTRQRRLADPSSDGSVIARAAIELLSSLAIDDRHRAARRVRLAGVSATGLERRDAPRQLTLDEDRRARGERLGDALDRINERFGAGALTRAVTREPSGERDDPAR